MPFSIATISCIMPTDSFLNILPTTNIKSPIFFAFKDINKKRHFNVQTDRHH